MGEKRASVAPFGDVKQSFSANHIARGDRFIFLKSEANQRPENVIIQKTVDYFVEVGVHPARRFKFHSSAAVLLIV